MPKINVYLPDDLAEAVKEASLPVSAICQRALEQAVRRVTAIRESILGDLEIDDPRLSHFTPRTRAVFRLALERARGEGAPGVGTEHLLAAMLAEGTNLALHVLRAMEIEPALVERDLAARRPAVRSGAGQAGESGPETGEEPAREEGGEPAAGPGRFDALAANALELAVAEAQSLGHNYIGCEHLLLGLAAEPEGIAGEVLRARGAEPRLTRRTVVAALAGYVHLRAQAQEAAGSVQGGTGQGGAAAQGGGAAAGGAAQGGGAGAGGAAQGGGAAAGDAAQIREAVQMVAAMVRREIAPLLERVERLERHAGVAESAEDETP
ncbi:Clp protease N-terminal domain-containing protein [Microbispora triticiradicis]|uniref:ATP-dependent Clp protease ATP-binding subunit n=2 Tax=Microbispora TaxID=2005 RepID=A0ABY3M4D7_9ACTN|nr:MULTISPECIES: Clp protease N-terminal domain-containing protein [Microbispora]TLP56946.1 ATP-dependent Clp protease ATP-binding subunit [Microbispora fusca]TYB66901.1 ATP-dependent Clp protease ATP-binding subunit [Microbispora tritici]